MIRFALFCSRLRLRALRFTVGVCFCLDPMTGTCDDATPPKREEEAPLLLIGNRSLVAGVLPQIGGLTVVIRTPDGPNLIDARPEEWTRLPEGAPLPPPTLRFRQLLGQTVWLGPQAAFWEDQSVLPEKQGANWPPDPTITRAGYRVLEHRPDRVSLESPPSPVWGVVLTKHLETLADGRLRFEATAINIRKVPVRKGLWFNLRALPEGRMYVPLRSLEDARLDSKGGLKQEFLNGFYSLTFDPATEGPVSGKAFLTPADGFIATEVPGGFLLLRFEPTPPGEVAPGQAPIEIYRSRDKNGILLLELEHHGPYTALEAGKSLRREEWIEFVPYSGPDSPEARTAFLKQQME